MNPLSSELPFHVHNWLIISLKNFCIVIRKWPNFWPSSKKVSICYVEQIYHAHIKSADSVNLHEDIYMYFSKMGARHVHNRSCDREMMVYVCDELLLK